MPHPRVLVLGPVEIWVGERRVHLTRLERSLVAVLALARGRMVSTDRLVDTLWSGRPPGSAHGRVQSLVSSVRRALTSAGATGELLRTRAPGYLLQLGEAQFDLVRFEAAVADGRTHARAGRAGQAGRVLRSALDLWRGRALDGVDLAPVEAEAGRFEELRLQVFEEWVDAELVGGGAGLVPDLRIAVDQHPTREHLRAQLMLLLDRAGRGAEALEVYRTGYRVLRDQLGIQPGPELRQIQQRILSRQPASAPATGRGAAGSVATGGADPDGATTAGWEPPNQLPPEAYALVGREREITALRELIDHPHGGTATLPALVALSGMAGVGKTALALAVAHAVRRDYPDGCLFADLRGHEAVPADPVELMGSFLRALGLPPQAVPDDPDARLAAYRSRTADRTLLILLDNARDEPQVRPLIPASGTATVLVTSRTALMGLDGAHLTRLDVLPLPAAVNLLRASVGAERVAAEPAAAERLAFLCGHLPLALRIAAARLASRTEMSVADAVARLADEHRRLSDLEVGDISVRSSLQVSYQRLDPAARALVRRFGLCPGADVPEWLPQVLLGSDGDADAAVDRLVDAQLLDVGHCRWTGAVRYRTHDLVRLFCHERTLAEDSAEVRAAVLRRTYLVLLQATYLANARLPVQAYPCAGRTLPSPAVPAAERIARTNPVGWFEAEWPRLLHAVDDAVARGWLDIAWRLVASLTNFLELTSRLDEGLRLHRLTLQALTAAARTTGGPVDDGAEAALLLGHARFLRVSERNAEAMRSLRRARLLFRRRGDRHGQAAAAISFGVAARSLGRTRLALAAFGHARRIARHTLPIYEGYALLGTGNVYLDYGGDMTEATRMLTEAVDLLAASGDRRGEGNALGALAIAYRRSGHHAAAPPLFERAASVFSELADTFSLAATQQAWAELYADLGEVDSGRGLAERALATYLAMGHPWGEAMARRALGRLSLRAGDPDGAVPHLSRSVQLFGDLAVEIGEATALFCLAQAEWAQQRFGESLRSAERAYRIYQRLDPRRAARVATWLAEHRTQAPVTAP